MVVKNLIAILIVVLIVGGVTVPMVNDFYQTDEQYTDDGWHYDDYKVIDDVESVSGVLETKTFSGVTYVHAKNVGSGTITYSDASTEDVTVSKANLDVIVALGQSNNAYVNYDSATAICPEIGTAYYYGTTSKLATGVDYETTLTIHPMVNTPGTSVIGDKAPAFCKEYYEHSYHKVYYIDGAWSGSSITQWQPDEGMYNAAATTIETAMSVIDTSLFNVETKGYTWIQGESDTDLTVSEYYDYFVTMHDSILDGGLGIELDHCFISKVKDTYANPSTAQIQLAKNLDTVTMSTKIADTFTVDNGLMGDDGVHYTQSGDNLIGTAFGESLSEYYYPTDSEIESQNLIFAAVPLMVLVALVVLSVKSFTSNKE